MHKVWPGLKVLQLCAVLLLLSTAVYAAPERELTLGVLAFRPQPETQAKWQPLADYLSHALRGRKVRLEILNYTELEAALNGNRLDFVLTNPGHYVQLRHKNNLSGAIATLVESEGESGVELFGGVIIARQDREDIRELKDLKGKIIAVVTKGSLGGYQAQALELLHAGVSVSRDTRVIETGTPHDLAVHAVLKGKADAGFVRSGVLEAMVREGKLDMSLLKVLNRLDQPAYPNAVSTQLYPEWPFVALQGLHDDITRQVAAALLGLEHDGNVARRSKIHGFTIPADYTPVENLLLELRLPPFDKTPQFTMQDVWQRYRIALIALIAAGLIICLLTLWLVIINRRLATARETARENEELFRNLFENVPVVSLVIDPADGSILNANTAATDFYGWSQDQLLRKKISEINTLSGGALQKELEAAKSETRSYFVFQHRRADGSTSDVEVYSGPVQIGGKTVLYSIVHDITDRKLAEQQISDAMNYIQALFNSSSVGIITYRATGAAVSANEGAAAIVGTTVEKLKEQNFRNLESWKLSGLLDVADRALATGLKQVVDLDITTSFGKTAFLSCHTIPFQFQGETHLLLVIIDITDRKMAEERISRLAQEMQTILDTLTVGVSFIRDRRVQWANAAHDRIFGYGLEGSSGLETSVFYKDKESYRQVGDEGYAQLLKGQTYTTEVEMKRRDGTSFWCSLTGRSINPDKLAEGSIWMLQDITERKQSDLALKEKTSQLETLTKTLEQRVKDEVALRLKNEQLLVQQSKLAAMGEMLGAIAHQWRQPLNTLGLCVQNINDAFVHGDLNRTYLDRTVQKSMDQIHHMSKTIDDFRNFFKPDKEISSFDTMTAVGDVLSLFSAQLMASDIGFRLTCHTHGKVFDQVGDIAACPEKTVDGYRNEFEHVILNLISNARDAIAARRESAADSSFIKGLITFDFFNRDGNVIIEVGDNGTGIPESVISRIFEPYFTMKEQSKGTGIGLYMSKIIIEDHMKGSLTAKNGQEGAALTIVLRQAEKAVIS